MLTECGHCTYIFIELVHQPYSVYIAQDPGHSTSISGVRWGVANDSVPRVGFQIHTSSYVLTMCLSRLPDAIAISTLYVYMAPCPRGQCRMLWLKANKTFILYKKIEFAHDYF